MTLSSKNLICLRRVFFAESDSGVTAEKKDKLCGGTPRKVLVSPFSWLKIFIKKIPVREPLAKLQLLSSLGFPKEAKNGIIDKVSVFAIDLVKLQLLSSLELPKQAKS